MNPRVRSRVNKIIRALKPFDPERVILFGSAARGDADQYSDIDIAIIKDTHARFLDRLATVYDLIAPDFALDILVYTPEEFAEMQARENSFAEEITREGIVIYEKGKEIVREPKPEWEGRKMKKQSAEEARRWFAQAEYDLRAAQETMNIQLYSYSCFIAQQAAEKALKAFLYAQGERYVMGHSVATLCKQAVHFNEEFSTLAEQASRLDRYYIPTRYPNGLPGGIPAESYNARDAQDAIAQAREICGLVKKHLNV